MPKERHYGGYYLQKHNKEEKRTPERFGSGLLTELSKTMEIPNQKSDSFTH